MTKFRLITNWEIPAPLEIVWDELIKTGNWPLWWKYVRKVEELEAGDETGLNNVRRFYWDTLLFYSLTVDLRISKIKPCQMVETTVSGDLAGTGRSVFDFHNGITTVQYVWAVNLQKPFMKFLSPVAQSAFEWNHQQVMKEGEKSLVRRLSSGP